MTDSQLNRLTSSGRECQFDNGRVRAGTDEGQAACAVAAGEGSSGFKDESRGARSEEALKCTDGLASLSDFEGHCTRIFRYGTK